MNEATKVVSAFLRLINIESSNFSKIGTVYCPIPKFPEDLIDPICKSAIDILSEQPSLLEIDSEIIIVGDLHGNLQDLIRIFATFGIPPTTKYLFLGDYVDRGDFSIEVISLLVSMMVMFPRHIFLLRGNHEFQEVNSVYGFLDQIKEMYKSDRVFYCFSEVFNMLPIAAVVNKKFFCVHGGLSSKLVDLNSIKDLKRPIREIASNKLLEDLMWSDPSPNVDNFTASPRGKGCVFGITPVNKFLSENGMYTLIRAHQYTPGGINVIGKGQIITVFSSSNYTPILPNPAVVLKAEYEKLTPVKFLPLKEKLSKNNVKYLYINSLDGSMMNTFCFKSILNQKLLHNNGIIQKVSSRNYPRHLIPKSNSNNYTPFKDKSPFIKKSGNSAINETILLTFENCV